MDGITSLIVCLLGLLVMAIVSIAIIYGVAYIMTAFFYMIFKPTLFKWIEKCIDKEKD